MTDSLSIENIIKREKLIVDTLKADLKTTNCKSCTMESIEYHNMIIYYLESLLDWSNRIMKGDLK